MCCSRNVQVWSNFHEKLFKLRALIGPLWCGPTSWESFEPRLSSALLPPPAAVLRLCSPPRVLALSHDSASCKGSFLGRKGRSHLLEILETETAESLFLGPEVHPDPLNLLEGFASLCPLSLPLPSLSVCLSLSFSFSLCRALSKEVRHRHAHRPCAVTFPQMHTTH